jgi:hypothetical protein
MTGADRFASGFLKLGGGNVSLGAGRRPQAGSEGGPKRDPKAAPSGMVEPYIFLHEIYNFSKLWLKEP